MIRSFRHTGLEKFYRADSKAGILPAHARKLRLQLTALDAAMLLVDLARPGWDLHALSGKLRGYWAISVSENWRITFRFAEENVEEVDYLDYH